MVAIVGGLLVARFVSIASEQEGAKRLVNDARSRLVTARRREQEARTDLQAWNVGNFFDAKVIQAIGDGKCSIAELREVGDYTPLSDEVLTVTTEEIVREFASARRILHERISSIDPEGDYPEWDSYRWSQPSLPETRWDDVWEAAYEDIVRPPAPPTAHTRLGGFSLITPPSHIPLPAAFATHRMQRRNELQANSERAEQHAEDIEEELARLQRAQKAIVRPKGLGWGLIVLGFFTVVGVIIPIWLMSRAPERLTAHLGEVVFWLFFAGLLALLGYMSVLALRLSGWRKKKADDHRDEGVDDATNSG